MLYPNLSANDAGHLMFAGQDTVALAEKYGTPLLLMDEELIRSRCRVYRQAMSAYLPAGSKPLYASKAFSCKRIYEIMLEEEMCVDVVSTGELYTAIKAGFPAENAYFHGNNKTDEDIRFAIQNRIGWFVCDSRDELYAIEAEASRQGVSQKILLRVQPGIDPHTHEKISTGKIDCKFGAAIETGQARELTKLALSLKHIQLKGFHCHIGSQIFDCDPFADAASCMADYIAVIRDAYGYTPEVLNLGGGMGVPYTEKDPPIDYAENIRKIGKLFADICARRGIAAPAVLMEPGRSIVADAGITLYTVGALKTIPGFRNYVSIDGGMTDNPRYTLYQAEYTVLAANRVNDAPEGLYTVAGRCCESGDLIQENVPLPAMKRGDLLAVLTTGAYNYSMASNYNRIPRPAVVFVTPDGSYPAVRRETLDDLLACDL